MTYENDVRRQVDRGEKVTGRYDVSLLKYLWQSSPLRFSREEGIHTFLSKVPLLNSFSDNELRLFSSFLHVRTFADNEVIFKQGDSGYGFYFVINGSVDIVDRKESNHGFEDRQIVKLERYQYFGEMGLLEEYNRRNATAIAAGHTALIGIFKPDLEQMLDVYPVVGAKFLREISLILAGRVSELMREVAQLRSEK